MKKFILTLAGLVLLSMPTHAQEKDTYDDPLEGYNRAVFSFNNYVDVFILDPITEVYRFTVPEAGRNSVTNFLRNLREPLNIANNLLQGDIYGAYNSAFRMTVNSFTGFGGLMDNAGREGYTYEREDFGQTLGYWGVPDGPYFVLPFLGPSSIRDHASLFIEGYADPFNNWAFNTEEEELFYVRQGMEILTIKDGFMDLQQDLRENSFDYYTAVKSILYQRNQALINDRETTSITRPVIPDYDDDAF